MNYIAESKNVKMSPRKVRLVVEGIKGFPIPVAISQLTVLNKRAASPVKKAIESAMANAVHNNKVNKDELIIKEILVNEGIRYKRFHYAARGRVRPYVRRSSHIRVILTEKPKSEVPVVAKEATVGKETVVKKATKK